MNYGLYLSATGVLANTYRQDVIANNLANVETVGFKRNIATFQQRLTEAQQRRNSQLSNPLLDHIGGLKWPVFGAGSLLVLAGLVLLAGRRALERDLARAAGAAAA